LIPPACHGAAVRCACAGLAGPDLTGLWVSATSYDPSHILVQIRPGASATALPGTTLGQALDLVPGLYEVNLLPGTTVTQALASYRADPHVLTAEPDYNVAPSWLPNDPRLSDQWNMHNTGQQAGR
jgi:hypothetical protein